MYRDVAKRSSASPPTNPAPAPSPLAAVVDELGELEKELAPFKTKIARAEKLRKQLREAHDASPAETEIKVQGSRYLAIVGPRGNQTVIDFAGLVKRIKAAAFARFATCTLEALEKNVSEADAEAVTRRVQTGPRSLSIMEKTAA